MKISSVIITALICCVLAFAVARYTVAHYSSSTNETASQAGESAFDRIMKTNTLRCGYAVTTPWLMVDPNTKQFSGADYDITNAVAAKIGVKVDWVEETGWGIAEQGLQAGRYDMMCGNVCIDPRRARAVNFSAPIFSLPLIAVVRANDARFDKGLDTINAKDVRVAVKNGHVFEFIANEKFPLAQKVYANDISEDSEFYEMLKFNKADVAFAAPEMADIYEQKNPGVIKKLDEPVRFCNGAFMLPANDEHLKHMIDDAIGEINSSGQIKEILSHYTKLDPNYVRAPALPFQER